jgi:hypothetical protein
MTRLKKGRINKNHKQPVSKDVDLVVITRNMSHQLTLALPPVKNIQWWNVWNWLVSHEMIGLWISPCMLMSCADMQLHIC